MLTLLINFNTLNKSILNYIYNSIYEIVKNNMALLSIKAIKLESTAVSYTTVHNILGYFTIEANYPENVPLIPLDIVLIIDISAQMKD